MNRALREAVCAIVDLEIVWKQIDLDIRDAMTRFSNLYWMIRWLVQEILESLSVYYLEFYELRVASFRFYESRAEFLAVSYEFWSLLHAPDPSYLIFLNLSI